MHEIFKRKRCYFGMKGDPKGEDLHRSGCLKTWLKYLYRFLALSGVYGPACGWHVGELCRETIVRVNNTQLAL